MKTELISELDEKIEPHKGMYFVWGNNNIRQLIFRSTTLEFMSLNITTGEISNVHKSARDVLESYLSNYIKIVEPVGFENGKLQFKVIGEYK